MFRKFERAGTEEPFIPFNWFRQVGIAFGLDDAGVDWCSLGLDSIRQTRDTLLENYGRFLRSSDLELCTESKSLLIYPSLTCIRGTQRYLHGRSPLITKRIFAQVRLLNCYICRIITRQFVYKFDANNDCLCCGQGRDDLFHILTNCPACEHLCKRALPELLTCADTVDGFLLF